MLITYLGHSCFLFENGTGVKLMIDPYTRVGYELPKGLTADMVLSSHGHFDHNYAQAVNGEFILLNKAGKYRVCGVDVEGFHSWHDPKQGALRGDNILFHFTMDGIRFCHFGDLGESYNEDIAGKLADADVWLIPVGGTYTIDASQAVEYMEKLYPKVVIPMHYKPEDGALDIAPIHTFLSLYSPRDIQFVQDGVLEIDKQTQGIFYLERAKTI